MAVEDTLMPERAAVRRAEGAEPGGTGTSAMLARYIRRSEIAMGETIKSEGLLGSGQFEGTVLSATTVGDQQAVVPRIKGTANILGHAKWYIDPDDPVGAGFVIA